MDCEATKKAEVDAEKADEALVSKVHKQEEATKVETVLDVDASLQIAPGTFLPGGEGLFALEGKSVIPIPQVGSQIKNDRVNTIKRVLSPLKFQPWSDVSCESESGTSVAWSGRAESISASKPG